MATIHIEALAKDVRKKMKNGEYSQREVEYIHAIVKKKHLDRKKGMKLAAILTAAAPLLMVVLMALAQPEPNVKMLLGMWAFLTATVLLILGLSKFLTDTMTRQFLSALHQGYPGLEEKYGRGSFKA